LITKKSRFVNYKALKKTFKTFRNDDFIEAGRPAYVKASRQILNKAKRNAPKKTGKMSRRIRFIGDANRKTTKGSLLNYTVYSNSIQDIEVKDIDLNPQATSLKVISAERSTISEIGLGEKEVKAGMQTHL
jgi:hypothetical protein